MPRPRPIRYCKYCNIAFDAPRSRTYCSETCQKAAMPDRKVTRYCTYCNSPFYGHPHIRYCSDECRVAARPKVNPRDTRVTKPCEYCGKEFLVQRKKLQNLDTRHRIRYCSARCRGYAQGVQNLKPMDKPNSTSFKPGHGKGKDNPMYVEPIALTCDNCHTTFTRKPWVLRSTGSKGRFCSIKCRGEYRTKFESGENSSMWVGGVCTYRGRGWLQARSIVVAEQGGKCAECGKFVGKSLPVHHKRPYREFATSEEANARTNLIGLCQSCHMRMEPRGKRYVAVHAVVSHKLG